MKPKRQKIAAMQHLMLGKISEIVKLTHVVIGEIKQMTLVVSGAE